MPGLILTFPIMAGKVEAWRRFCQELADSRQQMHAASRQKLGITRESVTLVETASGSTSVTTFEGPDMDRTWGQIISSTSPFDRWYRDQMRALHGIELAGYEEIRQHLSLPSNQELMFEWIY